MRIGTRGSALALAQATLVAERLGPDSELVTVTTAGDRNAGQDDKSRWVSELEQALIRGEIDLAVHSAKDVPAELPDDLELVAFPPRVDPRSNSRAAGRASWPTRAEPPGLRRGSHG